MKYKDFRQLQAYHGLAAAKVKQIEGLDSFLRGLQYRLRENPAAELEITVRRVRSARNWDSGATMKLPVSIIGKLLLPIVKSELKQARDDLRELPPIKTAEGKSRTGRK